MNEQLSLCNGDCTLMQHRDSTGIVSRVMLRADLDGVPQRIQAPLSTDELVEVALWTLKSAVMQAIEEPPDNRDRFNRIRHEIREVLR